MSRPRSLTPIDRIVEGDAQLKAWNDRRRREQAMLSTLRRVLPRPVVERLYITVSDGSVLELATGAGAIASVVRQRAPDIVSALQRDGWQFSGIRVRTQPRAMPLSLVKTEQRQWDSASRQPLVALQAKLAPGPLSAALARFLRNR